MSFFGDLWDNTAGGLLWKPLKKATGLTDAQMIGLGGLAAAPFALPAMGAMGGAAGASGAAAGASGAAGTAGASAAAPGLLSTFSQYAGPASQALNIAGQTKSMMQTPEMQSAPAQFQQGQGFGGLLTQVDQFDPEKRRKDQQMAMQGLLGGYRG